MLIANVLTAKQIIKAKQMFIERQALVKRFAELAPYGIRFGLVNMNLLENTNKPMEDFMPKSEPQVTLADVLAIKSDTESKEEDDEGWQTATCASAWPDFQSALMFNAITEMLRTLNADERMSDLVVTLERRYISATTSATGQEWRLVVAFREGEDLVLGRYSSLDNVFAFLHNGVLYELIQTRIIEAQGGTDHVMTQRYAFEPFVPVLSNPPQNIVAQEGTLLSAANMPNPVPKSLATAPAYNGLMLNDVVALVYKGPGDVLNYNRGEVLAFFTELFTADATYHTPEDLQIHQQNEFKNT